MISVIGLSERGIEPSDEDYYREGGRGTVRVTEEQREVQSE